MITHLESPDSPTAPAAFKKAVCPAPPVRLTTDPSKATCLNCLRLVASKQAATRKGIDGLLYTIESAWAREDDVSTVAIERELRALL